MMSLLHRSSGGSILLRMKCPNCGAPARSGARDCEACGCALPDTGGLRVIVEVLKSLDADLQGTWNGKMVVWAAVLFVATPALVIAGRVTGHLAAGLGVGLAVALFAFLMIGLELEHAMDRHFAERTKPRFEDLVREHGLSRKEALGIVLEELPESSALRKRLAGLGS